MIFAESYTSPLPYTVQFTNSTAFGGWPNGTDGDTLFFIFTPPISTINTITLNSPNVTLPSTTRYYAWENNMGWWGLGDTTTASLKTTVTNTNNTPVMNLNMFGQGTFNNIKTFVVVFSGRNLVTTYGTTTSQYTLTLA